MKHFWLIRHAKSENAAPGFNSRDFDRDLSNRGRRDGEQMQRWFAQLAAEQADTRPDWLVTSSAVRAAATSDYVARGFALTSNQTTDDPSLYNAPPEVLLDALRSTPCDARCTAIVAHNPGMTWLVNALTATVPESSAQQIDNLPTFGCALFRADVKNWSELTVAQRLLLITPQTLA